MNLESFKEKIIFLQRMWNNVSDITEEVETCVILHNMMVQECVDWDEQDNNNMNSNDNPIDNNSISKNACGGG